MEELLQEITNCENIQKRLIEKLDCPCNKIIDSQNSNYENFQLPEPWNGDLENCKILFLSSNPSFNPKDFYPIGNWNKSDVSDFFINRFSNRFPDKNFVRNELYTLQNDGEYSKNWIRFWAAVRSVARVILDTKSAISGQDYVMTEIVHCKSTNENGVNEAMETCANKYLDKIFKSTKAKIVICLGEKTSNFVKRKYQIEATGRLFDESKMDKMFLFLPHPNAREERKLNKLLTHDELEKVKNKLNL